MAAHRVTLGRDGLIIDGQPFFMLAGVIHYFRYPRAEWRDLLLKARACGVNTIDTVVPWNLHEPEEGTFNFADEADLAAYLDLCQELGLYAIVRPGPFICAEWENGGLPAWLTGRTARLRVDDPAYLAATLRWFDTLLPLVVPRQYTAGGPVILCQIENEHWASGVYGHDRHQQTLARAAEARGITVPQYTCQGGMRGQPELRNGWNNIAEKLQATRAVWADNPLMVSELWSGWFNSWGASGYAHKTPASLDRILHQLAAVGCSGLSHWMLAGGTNFGYWGGRTVGGDAIFMTTSYDYDALIGEWGQLRPKYYVARRHHLFLGTLGAALSPILADALPGGPQVIGQAAVPGRSTGGGGVYRSVRAHGDAPAPWQDFSATYLENSALDGLSVQLFLKQPATHLTIDVEAASLKPLFANMPLGERGLRLDYHTSRLLGFWQQEAFDLLVLYGPRGEAGELCLSAGDEQQQLRYWISDRPTLLRASLGARQVLVLPLTSERAERWWPLSDGSFLCGPALVVEDDDSIYITDQLPSFELTAAGELLASLDDEPPAAVPQLASGISAVAWTRHTVAERHDAQGWQLLDGPLPFEDLGCFLGYGWYQAAFEAPSDTTTTLLAPGLRDRARLLLDGADAGWLGVHPHGSRYEVPLRLSAGPHELRLCVDNLGRFNYGSNTGERKGLLDTLYLGGRQHDLSCGWVALWQEAVFAGEAIAQAHPDAVRPDAADVDLRNFPWQGPSVWLLRTIEVQEGNRYLLQLTGDRNPGALFVNGVAVERFSRHRSGGLITVALDNLLRPGENVLALNIQGYGGQPWQATLLTYAQALDARWSFRAGVTPGPAEDHDTPGPCFWRASFGYDGRPGLFAVEPYGLSKGQLWINGRNLGRYWQVGPQERYKLPASWLEAQNELLVFDEEGATPQQVQLVRIG